jgi:hypothetical protein
MVQKGATDWEGGLQNACDNGHMELAQLMIQKGAPLLYGWFGGAIINNKIHLIEYYLKRSS